jgi:hypothetical protein
MNINISISSIAILVISLLILVIYFTPTTPPTTTPPTTTPPTTTPPTQKLENYEQPDVAFLDKLLSGIDNYSISNFQLKIEKLDCVENSNGGLDIKIKTGSNGSTQNLFGLTMFQFAIPDEFKVNDSVINKKIKVSSKGGLFSNSGVSKITIDDTLVFDNLWVYSENNPNTIQKTFFEMLLTLIGLNKEETGTYTIKPGGWFVFQTKDPNTIFKGLRINKYHHVPYVPAIRIDKSSYIEGSFNFKSLPFENTSWFPFSFQYENKNLIINIYPDDLIKVDKYKKDEIFSVVIDKSILSCKVIRSSNKDYPQMGISAVVTDVTQK